MSGVVETPEQEVSILESALEKLKYENEKM